MAAPPALTRSETRAFYERFGARQDRQAFYEEPAVEELIRHADLRRARAVAEFGCGTGRLARRLLDDCLPRDATYWGCDLSPTMVALARERLRAHAHRAEVVLTAGDLHLPLPEACCDRFLCTYVLDLLAEWEIDGLLAEAHRLRRGGGLLCLASLSPGVTPLSRGVMGLWRLVHRARPSLVGGCRPIRLAERLAPGNWTAEHRAQVVAYGICSEVVIASKPAAGAGGTARRT